MAGNDLVFKLKKKNIKKICFLFLIIIFYYKKYKVFIATFKLLINLIIFRSNFKTLSPLVFSQTDFSIFSQKLPKNSYKIIESNSPPLNREIKVT